MRVEPSLSLQWVARVSVVAGLLFAVFIAVDIVAGRRQKMGIMNVVWPLTALWSGPIGLAAYFLHGRAPLEEDRTSQTSKPFWKQVALGATHCGAGCTLGDVVAENLVILWPLTLLGSPTFGTWLVDFALAFLFGIVFQYFSIAPMRDLGLRAGLVAAVKADTASLAAWQIGMYGWMAIALFVLFSPEVLPKSSPVFWFMMQVAMFFGFVTSFPVNWWLLRRGLKESM